MDKERQQLRDVVELVWKSALAFVGVTYITGFLVLFTFFNRMGIERSGGELLRIRYIHAGVLCLGIPIFVLLPVATIIWWNMHQPGKMDNEREALALGRWLAKRLFDALARLPGRAVQSLKDTGSDSQGNKIVRFRDFLQAQAYNVSQKRANWPAVILVFSLGLTFYCFVLFATRQYLYTHLPGLAWMLAVSLLLQIPRLILVKISIRLAGCSLWFTTLIQWLFGWFAAAWALGCASVLLGDINEGDLHNRIIKWALGWFTRLPNDHGVGEPIHNTLIAALFSGYIYLIFLAIAALLFWALAIGRAEHASSGEPIAVYAYAPFAAIIMSLYLLATLAFAHKVFAFIPVSNGGGDYSHSPDAQICMKPPFRGQVVVLPKELSCLAPVPDESSTTVPPIPVKSPAIMPTPAECSTALKVIDTTEQTIFVARSDDFGHKEDGTTPDEDTYREYCEQGAKNCISAFKTWREGIAPDEATYLEYCEQGAKHCIPASKTWREGVFLPKVYALNRTEIVSIKYDKDLANECIR